MFQKVRVLLAVLMCISVIANAQDQKTTAVVKGHLVNKNTQKPAADVQVTLPQVNLLTVTDGQGDLTFSQVPFGTYIVIFNANNTKPDTITISVNNEVTDLGTILFDAEEAPTGMNATDFPTIALDEGAFGNGGADEDGNNMQNVSGMFTASRDPFLNTASFVFGPYRFQARGYERNAQQVQINGILMNDIETDNAYWNQWGGLNDVFRSRENTYGLAPSEFGFGAINGLVYYDATAANQRKQTRVTYSLSNRTYRHKLAVTHSSGMMSNGWAYSISGSKRWAKEGYIAGTFYDGYSFYGAVSKKVNDKHTFNLTAFGAPTVRGKVMAATEEAYELADTNFYNPNWGYQEGQKRNSRVSDAFQPQVIFNYEYHPTNKTKWNTSVGYQFGKNKNSTLDWYAGADPRADYYRDLPSLYAAGTFRSNPAIEAAVKAELLAHPEKLQINWARLYEVNRMNEETMPGSAQKGNRSVYVISNDVEDMKKWVFNTNIEHALNEHITVYGGLNYINQRTDNYRELADLLGGDYFLNFNQFAERQYVGSATYGYYDLDGSSPVVKEGDRYLYNYISQFHKATAWGQATASYNKFDFFLAANGGFNSYYREGMYRNGLFPDNSKGKSKVFNFTTFGVKGGVTYKLNGRNFLFANGSYSADAPPIDHTYISIRTRDFTVANPTTVKTRSFEGGYLMRAPRLNVRAVGYVTDIKDATDVKRFYHDDFQNFLNMTITGIDTRSIGAELAVDVKLHPSWSVTGVAAIGQAFYTKSARIGLYRDNDTTGSEIVKTGYIGNYYLGNGPQSNYNLGLTYRSPHYWSANINASYFDHNYVDINPERRSEDALGLLQPGSAQYEAILHQEKLPSFFVVNLFLSKSILLSKIIKGLPRSNSLYVSLGVNNLLNNKRVITGGYEWLRFDYANQNVGTFDNKYFYGYGTNYLLNVSLNF